MKKVVIISFLFISTLYSAEPQDYIVTLIDGQKRLSQADVNALAEHSSVIKNIVLESEGYEFSLPIPQETFNTIILYSLNPESTHSITNLHNDQLFNLIEAANFLDMSQLLTISINFFVSRLTKKDFLEKLTDAQYFNQSIGLINPDIRKLLTQALLRNHAVMKVIGSLLQYILIEPQYTLQHTDYVNSVVWSFDGTKIATGSLDRTTKIWDAQTGILLHTLQHQNPIRSIALNPEGTKIVTGYIDPIAKIWDIKTVELLHSLEHQKVVRSVAWSPDGTKIATGSLDDTAKIWDAQTALLLHTFNHQGAVWSVAWSSDSKKIATGSWDRTAKIWDVQTGALLHTLQEKSIIWSVGWSPNGTKIATGSADDTVKIWDVHTEKLLHTLQNKDTAFSIAGSPDGTKIVTGSWDNSAKIWDIKSLLNILSNLTLEEIILILILEHFPQLDINQNPYLKEMFDNIPNKELKEAIEKKYRSTLFERFKSWWYQKK